MYPQGGVEASGCAHTVFGPGGTDLQATILVTGAAGQLGRELQLTAPPGVDCVALSRDALDICDPAAIRPRLDTLAPRCVINAAAYTAVDQAESEPARARLVNAEGPAVLAQACAASGIRLVHVSTDFVFDGSSGTPYGPDARPAPLGEYGRSKLLGEQAVAAAGGQFVVVRTGWVYSRFGGNFVLTMLRLMAQREALSVVCDQVGTPTWARGLARFLWLAATRDACSGTYHWSDAGVCSWYDFALAIAEEAAAIDLLERVPQVRPIPAVQYPTPAVRPAYSVLDKGRSWGDFELEGEHWRSQLRAMLLDYKEHRDDPD